MYEVKIQRKEEYKTKQNKKGSQAKKKIRQR